jgi:flavin reductase (DIM6/NTAB) family NADH-FMN oxidoreductase RutF
LLGRFATGVTVVTARTADGRDVGMTASSLSSVSLVPPLVLVCIDRAAELHDTLAQVDAYVVNILASEQEELSRRFATREADMFRGVGLRRTLDGLPVLEGALAHLECVPHDRHEGGDHSIFVGRVVGGETANGTPLIYFRGGYAGLSRE